MDLSPRIFNDSKHLEVEIFERQGKKFCLQLRMESLPFSFLQIYSPSSRDYLSEKSEALCPLTSCFLLASSYPHGPVCQIHSPPPSFLFLPGQFYLEWPNLAIQLAIIRGLDYEFGPKGNAQRKYLSQLCPYIS